VPRASLSLVDATALLPEWPEWKGALKMLKSLYKSFEQESSRFKVQLTNIYPMVGDCKIIDKITQEEVFIELKSHHCRIVNRPDPIIEHLQYNHFHRTPGKRRSIFCWKAQWDFIYTLPNFAARNEKRALLIPRDEIPPFWWNRSMGQDEWLVWPSNNSTAIEKYAVALDTTDGGVADMERILLASTMKARSMKAQIPIPVAPLPQGEELETSLSDAESDIEANLDDAESEMAISVRKNHWFSSYRRGFGSSLHTLPRKGTCQSWPAEALMELCRRRYVLRPS